VVATERQVEQKLRQLIRRLEEAGGGTRDSLAGALPDRRVVHVHVTDLDTDYWTDLIGGRMGPLRRGSPPRSDIVIQVSGDHLVELVDGRASLFSSYVGGRVKIEASFADLMRVRKLV
jgi:hypothetical protein